jgi:outer membrane protein TolC
VGIPADLIRRRPDIRRAEREVAAQSAQIGVAVSELFPHFSITGFLGWDSENLSSLLQSNSFAGIIGAPSVEWSVLNYGRLLNNVRLQDARFQELALAYQQQVLQAGEEAEQAINSFLRTQEEVAALARAVEANRESVELAGAQYSGGFVDFNRVFTLQAELVASQDELAAAQGGIALSLIAIYKSLGGGWQIRNGAQPFGEFVSAAEGSSDSAEDPTFAEQVELPPIPMERNAQQR